MVLNAIKQAHSQRDFVRGSRAVHSDSKDHAAVEKWGLNSKWTDENRGLGGWPMEELFETTPH